MTLSERIYTVERAARYLGVHKDTVLAWINRGELAAAPACETLSPGRAGVRRWLIRHSALVAFVARHERPARAATPAESPRAGAGNRRVQTVATEPGRPWPKPV